MKTSLNLNGTEISFSELAGINPESGSTPFEKSTLGFCKQWMNGEENFSLQTSGSTGNPKEIVITRAQMEASARLTIEALHLSPGMYSLVCLDTKYIAGKMMLVRSLINKMNIIPVEPTANPFKYVKDQIDFAAFVPYQVEKILEESKEQLDHVDCAIVGGASVSIGLREKMQGTSCRLYATYGMTETISHIALQKLNGDDASDFFTTQPGVAIKLNDRGCLVITANYLGAEPIITNDLVELLSPTTFKWIGRADNIINSGGVKISPEKIERVFEQLFFNQGLSCRLFAGSIPESLLGQQVVLVVESEPFSETIQQLLLNEASLRLSKYEIPRKVLFAKKFIETATGKVNRQDTIKALQLPPH